MKVSVRQSNTITDRDAHSRQRHEQLDSHVFTSIDLGLSAGFEADLTVDEHELVRHYPQLFERLE
jgi:hypothetical protein